MSSSDTPSWGEDSAERYGSGVRREGAVPRSNVSVSQLAGRIREPLGPPPDLGEHPLISIVVLTRDGLEHLRRLLVGLTERTDYPHLELIVVDNGSSDGSLDFIRSVEAPFPISIVANPHNESFSDANNQGAELARGSLLLLLNNDIEPIEPGWLRELVACLYSTGAGAVGPTLITREEAGDSSLGYRVQTRRFRLRDTPDGLAVDGTDGRHELFADGFGEDVEAVLAIGACILIDRHLFQRLGGFAHGYFYGGEDIDLFLKLRERGRRFLHSGRSILIHHASATRRRLVSGDNGFEEQGNNELIAERWGPRIWREYQLDRLSGRGLWAAPGQNELAGEPSRDEVLSLGFCLKADELGGEEQSAVEELEAALLRRGYRCVVLRGRSTDHPQALYHDVAVYVWGSYRNIPKPGQLNVLWIPSQSTAVSPTECGRYDLVATGDADLANRLRNDSRPVAAIAVDGKSPDRLIDAMLARAREIRLPLRIEPVPSGQ